MFWGKVIRQRRGIRQRRRRQKAFVHPGLGMLLIDEAAESEAKDLVENGIEFHLMIKKYMARGSSKHLIRGWFAKAMNLPPYNVSTSLASQILPLTTSSKISPGPIRTLPPYALRHLHAIQ